MSTLIEATAATTHDTYDPRHAPVASVEASETFTVVSLDASGFLEPQDAPGARPPQMFAEARGHCLTGPIEVRGAKRGDLLAVRFHHLEPAAWGWTVAGALDTPITRRLHLGAGAASSLLWDIDGTTAVERRHGLARVIAPFLGVTGTAPAAPGDHSTIPPRARTGGNIDCRELVAGSTLYLPVDVDGALLYLGDGHAAQGDGEVGGTAIECGMTTTVSVEIMRAAPLPGVHAETPAGRITFGFDADLNAAMRDALAAMTTWLEQLHGLDRPTALAFASTAVDLRITQVANRTWGVHAVLPHDLLARV